MLNPSLNQLLVFLCVAIITASPFYFRIWAAKGSPQPAEVDRQVSILTSIIFGALFLGAFVFSENSRASGEVLLAAAILSFAILYRSRWAHLSGRAPRSKKPAISSRILAGKAFYLGTLSVVAFICARFPLLTPLFVFSFPFLAPWTLRIQYPCEKMAASSVKSELESIFKKAGTSLTDIYLIDSREAEFSNAFLARKTLFLTLSLFEKLNETELAAVVYHEAAHLKQAHVWKRLFAAISYLTLGIFWAVLPFCLWMPGSLAAATASIFGAVIIQLYFVGRKIHQQELEADFVAVQMGASSEALRSALEKLSPRREKELTAFTRFIFGVYHPSTAVRVDSLRESGSLVRAEIFPRKPYFAAYSLFVVGFLFYSAQNFDSHLARNPAASQKDVGDHAAKISHPDGPEAHR